MKFGGPRAAQSNRPIFWRDPALPFVEARQAWDSRACYRPHTHPTVSVGMVDQGSSVLTLAGEAHHLHAGDVVVIDAGQVHACNPHHRARWSYRMYYFDANWVTRVLLTAKVPLNARAFSGRLDRPAARRWFADITRWLQQPGRAVKRERELARCVAKLYRLAGTVTRPPARNSPPTASHDLEKVSAYLAEHCAERIPIRILAARIRMSPYRLIRAFKRQFGLTPHAYQLDHRIRRARELVKAGHKAPDIAYALGFADQSHFQRAFKTRVAATPGEYHRKRGPLRAA